MTARYIAFVACGPGREAPAPPDPTALGGLGLARVFGDPQCLVLASADAPVLPIEGGRGVVVGALFDRQRPTAPVRSGDSLLDERAADSAGESLIEAGFGGYVAILRGRAPDRRTHVLRDPSGAMPCYRLGVPGGVVLFSDIAPIVQLGLLSPDLDPVFLVHHFAFRHLRARRTGLAGVRELLAGVRLTLGPDGCEETCVWSPWRFAAWAAAPMARPAAVEAVRRTVCACVEAWASSADQILLELSGGLDSSIVAAALKARADRVTCVTLYAPNAGGDERRFAERTARAVGLRLVAAPLSVEAVDVTRPPAILQPRPGLGALQQAADEAFLAQAERLGVDAFFGGGGGDNVFCYLTTAAPVLDAWRAHGPDATTRRAVADLAALHDCAEARVVWLALKKLLRGPPPRWRRDLRFLTPEAAEIAPEPHPWLDRPPRAAAGKVEHIASLMQIQTAPDGKARQLYAPVRHPLLAQPLVELCLSLPSWMWIAGGRNRSLAREAFEGLLPAEVLQRRTKGEFVTYSGQIYAANRHRLADFLLGGWLDRAGVIDRSAVEAYLANPAPPSDPDFFRLLEMAGVEAWARAWSAGAGGALRRTE
jgi:asparagine synthase (glutamine-hydrolysing)